jgi:hypothetical protein
MAQDPDIPHPDAMVQDQISSSLSSSLRLNAHLSNASPSNDHGLWEYVAASSNIRDSSGVYIQQMKTFWRPECGLEIPEEWTVCESSSFCGIVGHESLDRISFYHGTYLDDGSEERDGSLFHLFLPFFRPSRRPPTYAWFLPPNS